ncbi:hypothetical protein AB8B12_33290, partial [Streptomyces sp. PGLac3x]
MRPLADSTLPGPDAAPRRGSSGPEADPGAGPEDAPERAPADGAPSHPLPWEELVKTALLGTDRRAAPVSAGADGNAPGALLAAAAVRTVRYRAGLRPAA